MLRDITLGQYYQTESAVHRLDPRVKLIATVVFIISLFLVDNFWGYLTAGLFLAFSIRLYPPFLSDHRLLGHDPDHHAEQPDGRHGEPDEAAAQTACARA